MNFYFSTYVLNILRNTKKVLFRTNETRKQKLFLASILSCPNEIDDET